MKLTTINILLLLVLITSCTKKERPADWIVVGKIWTGNPQQPWAEAFAVSGDSIVAVGSKIEMEKWKGVETKESSYENNQLITPGFIDTHTHFVEGGFRLSSVQLRDAKTKEEFVQRIKAFAETLTPGTWITGGDWDHENWGGELPNREWIDPYTPNNPVWINRLDGHMSLANSATLKAANITALVKPVEGGTIVKDKSGILTGIFKDNAERLISPSVPAPSPEWKIRQ